MFNNVVLEVFIGLIFVFLLYSLLATILQELIARWMNLRARMLLKALRRMLEDDNGEIIGHKLDSLKSESKNLFTRIINPIKKDTLLHKFYSHPTIKYLGEDKLFSKPSYLHAHNFSQTIIQLLRGDAYDGKTQNEAELIWNELENNTLNINEETKKNLRNFFTDVRRDSYLFKNKLEDWFEETMERASGWYKKQTQLVLLLIGFAIALFFNVDSIAIAKILMKDKKVREQMVQLAISRQESIGIINDSLRKIKVTKTQIVNGDTVVTSYDSLPPVSDAYLESTYKDLNKESVEVMGILGLSGIAKKSDTSACTQAISYYDGLIKNVKEEKEKEKLIRNKQKAFRDCLGETKSGSPYQKSFLLKFIGWLLTALAISLGAPFWFDLLNKFVKFRASGPKPANTSLQDRPATAAASSMPIKGSDNKEISG